MKAELAFACVNSWRALQGMGPLLLPPPILTVPDGDLVYLARTTALAAVWRRNSPPGGVAHFLAVYGRPVLTTFGVPRAWRKMRFAGVVGVTVGVPVIIEQLLVEGAGVRPGLPMEVGLMVGEVGSFPFYCGTEGIEVWLP